MAAVTQYSCINDADVAVSDESHTDSNGNLALFFEIPNENHTRSAESSGVTETLSLIHIYLTHICNFFYSGKNTPTLTFPIKTYG